METRRPRHRSWTAAERAARRWRAGQGL